MTVRVDLDHETHLGVITIDRPEVRNAVDGATARAIEAAVDRLEGDDDIWVGVLTGTSEVFCAGADVREIAAGNARRIHTRRGGFGGFVRLERTKPFIAAVEGPALAGGAELVLACDLVVASTAASFGLAEVRRAVVPGGGGLFRLPQRVGLTVAMEWLLTGDAYSAEEAHAVGLVNALCPPGEAVEHARRLAARITRNAPLAVRASRRVALASVGAEEELGWERSAAAVADMAATADFAEGMQAFVDKRPPRWTAS
jgi:enoyl-CoA hydratase